MTDEYYKPRPGTAVERAIAYCAEHGPCNTTTLCREVGVRRSRIPGFMARPIEHGLMFVSKVDGENWYDVQPIGEAQIEIDARQFAHYLQQAWMTKEAV